MVCSGRGTKPSGTKRIGRCQAKVTVRPKQFLEMLGTAGHHSSGRPESQSGIGKEEKDWVVVVGGGEALWDEMSTTKVLALGTPYAAAWLVL